jgi:hypothetical protein
VQSQPLARMAKDANDALIAVSPRLRLLPLKMSKRQANDLRSWSITVAMSPNRRLMRDLPRTYAVSASTGGQLATARPRVDRHDLCSKLGLGVRFADGIEVARSQARAAAA